MSKPRIAYLFSRYPVVSQTFCDSEMLALEERGFDLEIASLNPPPNSFRHERLDRLKAEVHYMPPAAMRDALAKDPEFEKQLGNLIADHDERYGTTYKARIRAKNAWYFAKLFRRLGVQHVHVHFANRATHSALFLKKLGFTFSFTAHAQDFMFDLGRDDLLAEMARESEFVVAVSDFSKGLLVETCNESAKKMVRIYNGIEVADFTAVQVKERPIPKAVSVGRLIEFKGFHHLIRAAGILKRGGQALEIRIIGEGPTRPDLEKLIMEENVADRVFLLGMRSQEEVKQELGDADLFVLPSIFDSVGASDILPTVITEAMASHLPVVSTTVAGIPEMVEHGVSGLLVEPGDESAMAAALATVAGDAELRRRIGQAGRARAEQLFTFDVTAAVLGDKFITTSPAERLVTPIIFLHHQWRGEALTPVVPSHESGVRWVVESGAASPSNCDKPTLERLEFLPDASVIESIWLRRPASRAKLERERGELGDAVEGLSFYESARNAVYLADNLKRRGTRVIHAVSSESVLTVWLLKRLHPELRVSAAVEEEPSLQRGLLSRLLPDFDALSVSDQKLREMLKKPGDDILKRRSSFSRTELKVGPLRIKRKIPRPPVDRAKVEAQWLTLLKKL
jgi:glycosyltransferase involved in cell wall biosynthesis